MTWPGTPLVGGHVCVAHLEEWKRPTRPRGYDGVDRSDCTLPPDTAA
jgi:hypothetical protein